MHKQGPQILYKDSLPHCATCLFTHLILLLFFYFLAEPHGMWDLSSPTRGRTCTPPPCHLHPQWKVESLFTYFKLITFCFLFLYFTIAQSVMVVEKELWETDIPQMPWVRARRSDWWNSRIFSLGIEYVGLFEVATLKKTDVWEDESSEILDSQRGRQLHLLGTLFYVEETAHSVSLGGKNSPTSYWGNSIIAFSDPWWLEFFACYLSWEKWNSSTWDFGPGDSRE